MKVTNGKTCKTCTACKRIYRKWGWGYSADKWYYCTVSGEMTKHENSCGNWLKREIICDLSAQRFDEVERDIKVLMQYFENK